MKIAKLSCCVAVMAGCGEHPVAEQPSPTPTLAAAPSVMSADTAPVPGASATAAAPPVDADPAAPLPPKSLDLTANGAPPGTVPAPAYAVLFDTKKSWKLSATRERQGGDQPTKARTKHTIDCKVAEVARYSWGVRARVNCKDMPAAGSTNLVEGNWFATSGGLYHSSQPLTSTLLLEEATFVLPPSPKPETKEEKDPEMEGFGSKRRVFQEKSAWCLEHMSWGGDEGWHSVCLDANSGFVSGSYGWAGGMTEEVKFTVR